MKSEEREVMSCPGDSVNLDENANCKRTRDESRPQNGSIEAS